MRVLVKVVESAAWAGTGTPIRHRAASWATTAAAVLRNRRLGREREGDEAAGRLMAIFKVVLPYCQRDSQRGGGGAPPGRRHRER
ncbi:hypothetical protein GCM10023194_39250 [Planotetraspora phitsanulokensis]|uniref:Uncharacterized protein n=1 Tax=Planotetraspora phitsanulokensis TaxID=575192 RepID=A0A8J3UA33_9ACTN|nr:hypothetical protein Pph01_65510 [Planotetraspora phitsanulokensis]